jgi:RimJ/RimL family protein N-acetyltransferase
MAFDPMLGWAESVRLRDGRCVLIRPTRRSDAEQVQAFVRGLSATSRRERFFLAYRELPPSLLERIVDADRQHGVSLVALSASGDGGVAVVGLAQYGVESASDAAEVGVVVGERWRRAGLATRMLLGLAEFATANGLERVHAEILLENTAALKLAAAFGAYIGRSSAGANVVRAYVALTVAQLCC